MGAAAEVGHGLRLNIEHVVCRHCGIVIPLGELPDAASAEELLKEVERQAAQNHTCTKGSDE